MWRLFPVVFCLISLACQRANEITRLQAEQSYDSFLPGQIKLDLEEKIPSSKSLGIMTKDQDVFPAQFSAQAELLFVPSRDILPGEELVVIEIESPTASLCQVYSRGEHLIVSHDDREILRYALEEQLSSDTLASYYRRSGFIHPFRTKSGRILTDGFPRGHSHQHGIFNAYTRSHFRGQMIDFWNQQAQLGTVKHVNIREVKSGPVFGSFSVDLQQIAYLPADTMIAIDETWTAKVFPLEAGYFLDWQISQKCHAADTVYIDEYHYGGTAFRGSDQWNIAEGAYDSLVFFTTDQGVSQILANHSRPRWSAMYGLIDQDTAGIAIVSHPGNFRHPQPIRVHPTMPYFCFAPMVLGEYHLAPKQSLESRYGLFAYDGAPDLPLINKLTERFSRW